MQNNDNMNPIGHDDMMNKDGMMDENCCGGKEGCCEGMKGKNMEGENMEGEMTDKNMGGDMNEMDRDKTNM